MRWRALISIIILMPCVGAFAVTVQQPRPFGYVLGDTLSQRILLEFADRNFDPAVLPRTERAGLWFARRAARVELAADKRRWLVLDYQLINAPQALMTVNLPSVTLKGKADNEVLTVPEWPISIGPLTPRAVFAKGGLQELRPDHPAPVLPTATLRLQVEIWFTAFGVAVVIWLLWWLVRSLRTAATQPFAQALREIRRAGSDNSAGAWLALHRAFDRTAQRSLQLATLPALFQQAPHLEAQRAAIEGFYTESYRRFFATTSPNSTPSSVPSAAPSPKALCAVLRRMERRHER